MPGAGWGGRQMDRDKQRDEQDLATTDQASIEFLAWVFVFVFVFQSCWHTFNPSEVFMFSFQPSE